MFEKMQVGTADGEDFGSVLQLDRTATGLGAADFVDLFNIYDGGAMDPPKSFAIQTIDQVFDGFVDQGFPIVGDDQCIFVVCLEIIYFFNRYEF